MDGGTWDVWVLGLVGILVFIGGPFLVWLALYRWMWKQRGRGFAEGWFEVAERREAGQARYPEGFVKGLAAARAPTTTGEPAPATDRTPTDPDVHAQYTITGKRIR